MPFVEQDELYKQFKLDEPWDSPHNMRLLPKIPRILTPFDGRRLEPHTTSYQVFVGKGAAFEGTQGVPAPDGFPDGTSNTVLIVQAQDSVSWTKPADLEYSPDRPLPKLGGIFPDSFQLALADGSTRSVSTFVCEKTLRAAITRNGGDKLGEDWYR